MPETVAIQELAEPSAKYVVPVLLLTPLNNRLAATTSMCVDTPGYIRRSIFLF